MSATAMLFGSAIDSWKVPLADLGASGEDAGRDGRYLFLPPGPADAGGRVLCRALADPVRPRRAAPDHPRRRHHAGRGGLRTAAAGLPLAAAEDPPPGRYIDAWPHDWHTLPTFDLDFLRLLAQVVDEEPAQEKDAVMLGALASIGIAKGHAVPARTTTRRPARRRRCAEAAAHMNDYFLNERVREALAGPAVAGHQEGRQLRVLLPRRRPARLRPPRRRVHVLGHLGTQAAGRPARNCPPRTTSKASATRRRTVPRRPAVPAASAGRHPGPRLLVHRGLRGRHQRLHPQRAERRRPVSPTTSTGSPSIDDGSLDVYIGPQPPPATATLQTGSRPRDATSGSSSASTDPQATLFDKTWIANDVERVH